MLRARSTYVRLLGVASLLAAIPMGGCIIDPNLGWTSSSSNSQDGDSGDDEESGGDPGVGDSSESGDPAPETGDPQTEDESSSSGGDDAGADTTDSGEPGNIEDAVDLSMRGAPMRTRFVRLTHPQWESSIETLLRLPGPTGLASNLSEDPPNGLFSNNERSLEIRSGLWGDYQRLTEELAQQVTQDGDALGRLTGGVQDSAAFIRDFGRRAFRRPVTAEEEARYAQVFTSGASLVGSGDDFADGVRLVVESMLQSPNFLYRTEMGPAGQPLSGYELASKLSFLLRDTTPDDALLDAAENGELDTPDGLARWATTLLDSEEAVEVLGRFHYELMSLNRYESINKSTTEFPNYSQSVNPDLAVSDELFFEYIYSQDLGFRDLMLSQVGFVNPAIAGFYGMQVQDPGFTQVDLGPERPGFFTRVGILALNATLADPDPIHRGVGILQRMLCSELAPPPGVIPKLPEFQPGQTNRDRVTAHTGPGTCGETCHGTLINPLGFAFENYDALGQLRDTDRGLPLDTSGEFAFPDGLRAFEDARELLQLMADSPQAHACYAKHVGEFALGRDLDETDRAATMDLMVQSLSEGKSLKELVLAVIQSPAFMTRDGGVQ